MADAIQTWPQRIYLVAGDLPLLPMADVAEVSWCADRIGAADVRYVREDKYDEALVEASRQLAGERLRADQGWQRYEEANRDRNAVREERVQMVARIAELERQLSAHEGAAADTATRQMERAR